MKSANEMKADSVRSGFAASGLRRANKAAVAAALREAGAAGIAELAAATGLSVATCATIAPLLAADGVATELDERASNGGRPARRYAYNPGHILVAGILIKAVGGRVVVRHRVADALGGLVAEGDAMRSSLAPEDVVGLVADLSRLYPALGAIGVSVPGVVTGGRIGICDVPDLAGVDLTGMLSERSGLAARIDNDMNFAALGYSRTHAERARNGIVFMVFPKDNCAGAGIVVDGRLVRGRSNFSGEISFIPLGGTREERGRSHAAPSKLPRYIARAVASVTAVINPDAVVLSGDAVSPDMMPAIRRRVGEFIPAEHLPDLVIRPEYDGDCFDGMIATGLEHALGGWF